MSAYDKLESTLQRSGNASARLNAKTTLWYAKDRIKATGTAAESKKFVNVGDEKGKSLYALATTI
eukprot:5346777-Prymnesium_polylepis.1